MSEQLLTTTMASLVNVLRELLANMEAEQHAILIQDAPAFQVIMSNRSPLLDSMQICRQAMVSEIGKLQLLHPEVVDIVSERDRLMNLAQLAGEENFELLTLRDQILALTEQMDKQNLRNNFLLNNQVIDSATEKERYSHQFKPTRRRLQPQKSPRPKKCMVTTLELPADQNMSDL